MGENSNVIFEKQKKAEAYFRKHWPKMSAEDVSDFGTYCVEKWLSNRRTKASFSQLGIDFLREFALRTGTRGSSDLMSQPTRVKDDPTSSGFSQLSAHSTQLRRFDESSLLRDRRLSREERIILILHYEWGFSLKEIGDLMAVSESRISQMLTKILSDQKKRIQKDGSYFEKSEGQPIQSSEIPSEIQTRSVNNESQKKVTTRVSTQKTETKSAMGLFSVFKIQKTIFRTFRINTF